MPQFHFFGGKGGVGKTTLASAFALAALKADKSTSVLIVSTDPAHSLRDALGPRLPARLKAVELDAKRALARWIERNRAAASQVLEHGTWLDQADIDALLELPVPGVDELMGLIEIDRLAHAPAPASRPARRLLVVVDTAPTGHTLRLLAAPQTVAVVAGLLDRLQEEHRMIRERFAGSSRPEAADRLIAEIARQAGDVGARLRSADTRFHWVTLAEAMSVAESHDALAALGKARIRVAEVIVNNVLTDEGPCPICDRRRLEQSAIIREIGRTVGKNRQITVVPAQLREPKGPKGLEVIAKNLSAAAPAPGPSSSGRRRLLGAAFSLPGDAKTLGDLASLDAVRDAQFIFVGGKGGVGKTTVAAAIALSVARARRGRRVLLLSTDPAHSLTDVLKAQKPSRLRVIELDAATAFAERVRAFERALDQIAGPSSGASELINLAPPGIDELFGMLAVFDAKEQYDTIVIDTAPTGHALRLLETPDVVREWAHVLMRTLLKYHQVVHAPALASELLDLSKGVRDLQALLRDPQSTRFLVVTRAAELPRLESTRLLAQLRSLRLATPALVVNAMTMAPGRCRRCRQTAAAEEVQLQALRRVARHRVIIRTPLAAPAPRGVRAIDAWRRCWV